MKNNVGSVDKVIQLVLALALFSLLYLLQGNPRWLGLFGLAPLVTAVFGFCHPYKLPRFSVSICPMQKENV